MNVITNVLRAHPQGYPNVNRKCILCYSFNLYDSRESSVLKIPQLQTVTDCCNKYLSEEILISVDWYGLSSTPNEPKFCYECFQNTAKLVQLHVQLENLQREMYTLVGDTTSHIVKWRKVFHSSTFYPEQLPVLQSESTHFLLSTNNDKEKSAENHSSSLDRESPQSPDSDTVGPVHDIEDYTQPHDSLPKNTVVPEANAAQTSQLDHSDTLSAKSIKQCSKCGKRFKKLDKLQAHVCGKSPWDCHICGRSISGQTALKIHLRTHSGEKPFKCTECEKCFAWKDQLERHKRVHTGEKPFQCQFCEKRFADYSTFIKHQRGHTEEKRLYNCPTCSKGFGSKGSLECHLRLHNNERPYICEICGKSYPSPTSLRIHRATHLETKQKCDVCDKEFFPRQLELHKLQHTGRPEDRKFICDQCGKGFISKNYLATHYRTHTDVGLGPFVCSVESCGKTFENSVRLRAHSNRCHPTNDPLKCETCGKLFAKKHLLVSHVTFVHEKMKRPKRLQCDICNKFFATKSDLTKHKKSHITDRPFSCELCGQKTKSKQNLARHMITHTEEHKANPMPKKFKCDLCDSAFCLSYQLKEHKMIHTGETPHECETCGKAFRMKQTYRNHLKLHSTDYPYTCSVCGKGFKNSQQCLNHTRKHEDPKYVCSVCSKKFYSSSKLNRHMGTHADKPFKCDVDGCDRAFGEKILLKYHTLSAHTEEKDKPFKCSACQKGFGVQSELNKHLKAHDKKSGFKTRTSFKCFKCNKSFSTAAGRRVHQRIHSLEEDSEEDQVSENSSHSDISVKGEDNETENESEVEDSECVSDAEIKTLDLREDVIIKEEILLPIKEEYDSG